jgi:hypothetical protein
MRKYYDKDEKSFDSCRQRQLLMPNGKKIRTKNRCKEWDDKMYGPFEVKVIWKNGRYCTIKLPDFGKIHPTFSITLLER